jgi:hemoglobin
VESSLESNTLFQKLGGRDAVDLAVNMFYQKVLADQRISHLFENVNIEQLRGKQKAFMTYAFGGAPSYSGLSMRKAHERLVRDKGLNDDHFNAVAENLAATLKELNVSPELITEVIAIVASARGDVLGK